MKFKSIYQSLLGKILIVISIVVIFIIIHSSFILIDGNGICINKYTNLFYTNEAPHSGWRGYDRIIIQNPILKKREFFYIVIRDKTNFLQRYDIRVPKIVYERCIVNKSVIRKERFKFRFYIDNEIVWPKN